MSEYYCEEHQYNHLGACPFCSGEESEYNAPSSMMTSPTTTGDDLEYEVMDKAIESLGRAYERGFLDALLFFATVTPKVGGSWWAGAFEGECQESDRDTSVETGDIVFEGDDLDGAFLAEDVELEVGGETYSADVESVQRHDKTTYTGSFSIEIEDEDTAEEIRERFFGV